MADRPDLHEPRQHPLGSGPAVFSRTPPELHQIEAIKALVRDQQLRVAASGGSSTRPDRGFHLTTIGTGQGELRIGTVPEDLEAYLPFRPNEAIYLEARFSYGSERPKQDDGKGMLGLSIRLRFPGGEQWNLTHMSSPAFLKNAEEVRLILQATKTAAEKYPSGSESRRALAMVSHILCNAPRGRKWALLKFGLSAATQTHNSVASTTFFNPITYALDHPNNGRSYAVRFEIQPTTSRQPSRSKKSLSRDLHGRYEQGSVVYSFGARFFSHERETPVDDPSVPWPTAFVNLGTLHVSPAPESERDRIAAQSYNPGRVVAGVRSLATINEVRNAVYEASQLVRLR